MAQWFVRKVGSDANPGTSAALAWATIGQALAAGAGPVGGDTIAVGGGVYREQVLCNLASPTSTLSIVADNDGSLTGDIGPVTITSYLVNDKTAPAATLATLRCNGRSNLAWRGFRLIGSGLSLGIGVVDANTVAGSVGWTFLDCWFVTGAAKQTIMQINPGVSVTANWLIDRCVFHAIGGVPNYNACLQVELNTNTTAEQDVNVVVKNSFFFLGNQGYGIIAEALGTAVRKAGGIKVANCTFMGGYYALWTNGANCSTTIPCTVSNSVMAAQGTNLYATAVGQIVENYNLLYAFTNRTNVTVGANSIAGGATGFPYAFLFETGGEPLAGFVTRPYMTPMDGSGALAFGANPAAQQSYDLLNRPRPVTAALADVGAFERHDTVTQVAAPLHGAATHSWQFTGPGDHDFDLPVDAVAQTPSIWVQYDANYGAGTNPQLQLRNGGECGVADQTVQQGVSGAGVWAQLTLASFTPTAQGVVTIRLVSAAAVTGTCTFSDFTP